MGNGLGNRMEEPAAIPCKKISVDELSSYGLACENDRDVCKFDMELQVRMNRVVNTLAVEVDQPHSLSFDSLREVTGCLLETDQQVVHLILAGKKDIWNNPELFSLIDDYFTISLQTLNFCTALEKGLKNSRDRQMIVQAALRRAAEEKGEDVFEKTLVELQRFRTSGSPFTDELFELFTSIHRQHLNMLERLRVQQIQLGKKLKRIRSWKKVTSILFAASIAAVLICSIVVAAMAAPPVVTAVVTAAGAAGAWAPVGLMGRWFDKLWKGYEDAVKGQREVVSSMHAGTFLIIRDLDNIRVLVEKLETEVSSGFVVKGANGVCFEIKEIEEKVTDFTKKIDELEEYVDYCSRNIHQARTVALQRIIKPPKQEN